MTLIYLDHAATTPLRPEVGRAMDPYLSGLVGNPSSIHRVGRQARRALQDARERVASLLGASAEEVRFVRGGTESVNLAVLGVAAALRESALHEGGGSHPVLLRSPLEHPSVRDSMASLEGAGVRVREMEWDRSAGLRVPTAGDLARAEVRFVSCQWVNHETGVILPIPGIAAACDEAGVPLHVDGVQAAGHLDVDLARDPISLLSLSGHKIGGPRSTGALVVRTGTRVLPTLFGGPQEGGLRPGTEDVAGAVGFAEALDIAVGHQRTETARLEVLRDRLEGGLEAEIPDLLVHANGLPRSPHVLGLGIPELRRDVLPGALDLEGIAVSAGSACMSGSTKPSPTLVAIYGPEPTFAPLRLSLGWTTTDAEVQEALRIIPRVIRRAREALAQGTPLAAVPSAGKSVRSA